VPCSLRFRMSCHASTSEPCHRMYEQGVDALIAEINGDFPAEPERRSDLRRRLKIELRQRDGAHRLLDARSGLLSANDGRTDWRLQEIEAALTHHRERREQSTARRLHIFGGIIAVSSILIALVSCLADFPEACKFAIHRLSIEFVCPE